MSADTLEEAQGEEPKQPPKQESPQVKIQAIDGKMVAVFHKPIRNLVLSPEGAIKFGKAVTRAGREARTQRARMGVVLKKR